VVVLLWAIFRSLGGISLISPQFISYVFQEISKYLFCLVVRSGDYYLFETDSEEEEEEELKKEDEELPRKSAFQVITGVGGR
jgi:hypothetical protein